MLILGPQGSGKTSLVRVLNKKSVDKVEPTQGHEVTTLETDTVIFELWDLSGHLDFQDEWAQYYEVRIVSRTKYFSNIFPFRRLPSHNLGKIMLLFIR